jgi:hypothetical protein
MYMTYVGVWKAAGTAPTTPWEFAATAFSVHVSVMVQVVGVVPAGGAPTDGVQVIVAR